VSDPKNQHYVPQAYLRRFAPDQRQVWVYDKQDGRVFRTDVRNVASETYFYDIDPDALEPGATVSGESLTAVERGLQGIEAEFNRTIAGLTA
jgi:hypothetical protein